MNNSENSNQLTRTLLIIVFIMAIVVTVVVTVMFVNKPKSDTKFEFNTIQEVESTNNDAKVPEIKTNTAPQPSHGSGLISGGGVTEPSPIIQKLPSPVAVSARTINGDVLSSSDVAAYRSFEAEKVIDGYYDSCWCINTKKSGAAGGSLRIDFAQKSQLSGIALINGNQYMNYDGLYHLNGQVKNFTLQFSDGTKKSFVASFNSSGDTLEYFTFDTPVATSSVTLTVDSGYVGTKFGTNVCIGEIQFY